MSTRSKRRTMALFIVGLLATLIMFFPVYWMFITSIKPMNEIYHNPPLLIPKNPTLKAYVDHFVKDRAVYTYFKNSCIIALGSLAFVLFLAAPASYALSRMRIRGKTFVMLTLLVVQMFPSIVLVTPLYIIFGRIGLNNNYLGLVLANATISLPFVILVLRPTSWGFPGAWRMRPLSMGVPNGEPSGGLCCSLTKPGLITVGAFSFLFAWGELLFAMTLTSKESMRPITAGIYRFIGQFQVEWNSLMAVAFLASLPIIVVFIALQKHIVSGITAGAVKQ